MALILLRHTEPVAHQGLCYGRLDLDLREGFESEAERIAEALPKVSRILTSPLSRCHRLAERIAERRQVPWAVEASLIEMDFGSWEGHAWAAIPRHEIDAWSNDLLGARPHGGETVAEMSARVNPVLEGAAPHTLLVAHAGVAKAAMAWSGHADPWNFRMDFGEWIEVPRPAQT